MPFKDIDWGKVAKQTQVSYNIGRTNALINAQSDKNIQKVELLSGTDLLQRDPLDEAIQMEKVLRKQQPIISKLKEISEKTISPQTMTNIMQNIPAIDYYRASEQPLAITSTQSDQVSIPANKDIDSTIIEEYNYKMPYDIVQEIASGKANYGDLENQQKQVGKLVKKLARESGRNPELKPKKEAFQKYNATLKEILANYDSFKKSTFTGKGVKNRIYYTNPKQLTQRLNVLIGEVQAGNNSKHIKNEIADIAHHLYKKKIIKKKEYRNILSYM